MKILVFSDSHASLRFMKKCLQCLKPDVMIHLGDYYDDAASVAEEFPEIPLIQVPGNCDTYRAPINAQLICTPVLDGVSFYLTHGHLHHVKMSEYELIRDANRAKAQIALYGHTHIAELHRESNGLWVMNPGTCGYLGGSAGYIEVSDGVIEDIRLIMPENLEEIK